MQGGRGAAHQQDNFLQSEAWTTGRAVVNRRDDMLAECQDEKQELLRGSPCSMADTKCVTSLIAGTFPSEPIVGQLDLIPQFAANEEIHYEPQPHQPHYQVAESNAERRLWGKRRSEFRR